MLKGHVFSEQLFHNECFAHFINLFLNRKNGVTKGCNITNTNNSITVNAGYFCVQGRFLEVVGSDTLQITPNTEYCKLVCEIDLSQTNTETQFNQASFKILTGTSSYPTPIKQDLENGGSIYQFEFAQFQNTTNGIINLKDTRTFLDFDSIYTEIREEYRKVLRQLQQELTDVENGNSPTASRLKTARNIKLQGAVSGNVDFDGSKNVVINTVQDNIAVVSKSLTLVDGKASGNVNYPSGFNKNNCIVISVMSVKSDNSEYGYGFLPTGSGYVKGALGCNVKLREANIEIAICNPVDPNSGTASFIYKVVLMKTS